MSGASTTVYLLTPLGERVAAVGGAIGDGDSDMVSLSYTSTVNAPGWCQLVLRAGQLPAGVRIGPDWMLEITRSTSPALPEQLEGQTRWFVRRVVEEISAGTLRLSAESALGLLATRTVAYAAGSAQASKSGPADDLIKAICRENLGELATDPARRYDPARFRVAADGSFGPTVGKAFARKDVLQVCQELAAAAAQAGAALAFDVVLAADGALVLQAWPGQRGVDRSLASATPLILDADALADVVIDRDYGDEATVVYAAGQGTEADREVAVSVSAASGRSPWARREATLSAAYVGLGGGGALAAEAARALWERRARARMSATIIASDQLRYGIDWGWGDRALISVAGSIWPVSIDQRTVTISGGLERVQATVRVEL